MAVGNLFVCATVAAAAYTPLPPNAGLAARSKIFAPATDTAARANIFASAADARSLAEEVKRRRNLAIISHPDAGKTTLTEKLLLYGGAIASAGAVKAKGEQRRATSDFMELEQQRGISISSTVLSYEYAGKFVNILDTPGHQDFSEDTYRTLAAADNAVMLIDAAKGLEPQTKKLFEVARLRRLPLFTFVNKLDRPSRTPYELCDEIESEFGVVPCPVLWPIGSGDDFKGVLDRRSSTVALFERGERGKIAAVKRVSLDAPELADEIEDESLYEQLLEDAEVHQKKRGEKRTRHPRTHNSSASLSTHLLTHTPNPHTPPLTHTHPHVYTHTHTHTHTGTRRADPTTRYG